MKCLLPEQFIYFLDQLDKKLSDICENNEHPKEEIHNEIMRIKRNFGKL